MEYEKPGLKLFRSIENKPISELSSIDIRLLNVCSIYTNEDEIDACVKGFFEGAVYGKEVGEEAIEKLKKEMLK